MNFEEFKNSFLDGLLNNGYIKKLSGDVYNTTVNLMNYYTHTMTSNPIVQSTCDGTEWETGCDAIGHNSIMRNHPIFREKNVIMNVSLYDCGCMHIANLFTGVTGSMCDTHNEMAKNDEVLSGGNVEEILAVADPEHLKVCRYNDMMLADEGTTAHEIITKLETDARLRELLKDVNLD